MPESGDPHLTEGEVHAFFDLIPGDPEVFEAVEDLVLHDGGDDLALHVLKDRSDEAGEVRQLIVRRVEAVHLHRAVEVSADLVGDDPADGQG